MQLLKNLFGAKLDGMALAQSQELKEYAQIDLLTQFATPRALHATTAQRDWSRVLPKPYAETIALFQKQGWLAATAAGYQVTENGRPLVDAYLHRTEQAKRAARQGVHEALAQMMTSEALTIRRQYENRTPLGKADWTGPEPPMNHSAVTRRIFFLDHWLLDGLSSDTVAWLKLYAAEEHLWGATWRVTADQIPPSVAQELARPDMDISEAVYWRAHAIALYVNNQETWQRVKGGDHVRRLEIVGPDDAHTCEQCRQHAGKQYLVARVPELPHRGCTSPLGCRCRYEPVLETIEEIPLTVG
ncbi:MAG: hypothetical protein IAE81_09270 [Caldilineaceae bacterium]|jgi:hypothetical protein|nr:hypothetical protein [Caldilineaceae bacterium]